MFRSLFFAYINVFVRKKAAKLTSWFINEKRDNSILFNKKSEWERSTAKLRLTSNIPTGSSYNKESGQHYQTRWNLKLHAFWVLLHYKKLTL